MRWGVNYNGLLALGADSQGMHVSVFFLFRVGHPPLFIPWSDISATSMRSWWFRMVRLEFEKYPSAYLLIPLKMAESLSHASGLQFQIEQSSQAASRLAVSNRKDAEQDKTQEPR